MGLFGRRRPERVPRYTIDDEEWWPPKPLRCGRITYHWTWWTGVVDSYVEEPGFSGTLRFAGTGGDERVRFTFSHSYFVGCVAYSQQQKTNQHVFVVGNAAAVLGLGDMSMPRPTYYPVFVTDSAAAGCVVAYNWLENVFGVKTEYNPVFKPTWHQLVHKWGLPKPEIRKCFLHYWCAIAEIYHRSRGWTGDKLVEAATEHGNQQFREFWH